MCLTGRRAAATLDSSRRDARPLGIRDQFDRTVGVQDPSRAIHGYTGEDHASGLSWSYVMRISKRGARLARREERAYREYSSDDQRRQAGPRRAWCARWGGVRDLPLEKRFTYDQDRPL